MGIIQSKYQQLSPRGEFLTDAVVLAQAWKKAHTYIRRHNWYADVLELDCSVIDLERQLAEWAEAIASDAFEPEPMMLVPAPKNARWDFPNPPGEDGDERFEAWGVAKNQQGERIQKLRPLAHLSIRDQSLATAVMLCLADAVESAQGDTSERNGLKAQQQGVFSYGNRLHCRWDSSTRPRPRAFFSWGNSRTYSQYFQDYRTFLARPRGFCADLSARLATGRELYIVSLDIKSFFDCIDRSALIGQLKMLYSEFANDFGLPEEFHADEDFWHKTERIFFWTWRQQNDKDLARQINGTDLLPMGLPQGLIASGFFANAYMVGFDRLLGAAIDVDDSAAGFRIRDYCRYVDDIRLVVEAESQNDAGVPTAIHEFVSKLLQEHCKAISADKGLTLNRDKMTATPYRSTSVQSNLSALMEMLQETISGTFDLDSLTQAAGGLDGLLWMSEQLEDPQSRKTSSLQLANIAVPNTDVRDDTVKRFVATRIASALRMRLAMTDTEGAPDWGDAVNDEANAGMAFSHEFEVTARKLIKCWADNPALALLLRVGLDLFPHPKLLGPVLDALQCKLYLLPAIEDDVTARQEVLVAEYVAADLLRAGAMETGYRDDAEYPDAIEIGKYRQELAAFARRILLERSRQSSWYLQQQALLFLASVGDHSVMNTEKEDALESYRRLHQSLLYFPCKDFELEKTLPLSLVGQQLAPDPDRFAAWLVESLRSTKESKVAKHCVLTVALNRPDLMLLALKTRSGRAANWKQFVPSSLRSLHATPSRRALRLVNGTFLPLHCVISDRFNPFAQENALLALANALLGAPDIELALGAGLHVGQIEICCKDWSRIQALPDEADFLNIQFQPGAEVDPLYKNPAWVDEQAAWLYGLGRILRSCITGEFDFTAGRYLATEEVSRYTGLRSTWFKRRFGLLNTARGLLDEPAPVSSWLSSLLSVLLRWPGTDIKGASAAKLASAKTKVELLEAIHDRIAEQRLLYGERSGAPMYVVQTQEDRELAERPIRIAVVQPMLPRRDQFNDKEPCRWTEKLMAQHRRHLAEVCRLTYQKLRTWATAQYLGNEGNNRIEPLVDLILFPELSVHPEHVFHLRVLSDKVKATIFAGLTFIDSPKHLTPINQALWLIRTETPGGRTFQYAWQGKKHLTKPEEKMGVKSYRPHQVLVEFPIGVGTPTRVAGAICYDATDLALVADLRERSDIFLVAALNQDVQTFDNMVAALHFHMYQPVVLANMGEFGGSTAQVPLLKHERLIAHIHGNNQVAVSVFEIDPTPFKLVAKPKPARDLKTPPAGYKGRPLY